MRVIAGTLKGRRLQSPTWEGLRPTSDRLRGTLFNILGPRVAGATVLDGFAGTGALGIEAISRGAARVMFVEKDRRAAALIEANLRNCGVQEGYTIQSRDLSAVLQSTADGAFDLILLDPPYELPGIAAVIGQAAGRLGLDGLLVLERATRREIDTPSTLTRVRDVKAGDSTLTFLRRAASELPPEEQ